MDLSEAIDQEILKSMCDLCWKQCYRFAEKWNLPTKTVADLKAVRDQLERDFRAAHQDLDFDEEWRKCFPVLTDREFGHIVSPMVDVSRRQNDNCRS